MNSSENAKWQTLFKSVLSYRLAAISFLGVGRTGFIAPQGNKFVLTRYLAAPINVSEEQPDTYSGQNLWHPIYSQVL